MPLSGLAVLPCLVTLRALPVGRPENPVSRPVPVASMAALASTAAVLSLSSALTGFLVPLVVLAGLLLVLFLVVDARDANGVLPRLTYVRGNHLKGSTSQWRACARR
ncbi:hypothetical protein [Streptomyces sp. SID8352]|uniref:hypothetical protein n=1 Tax=Streptomyces sp. SID8352 TaxID=2690338 RepID=UPI00136E1D81|nr:hypothetical protein [Streptomyces sp. SID8352]MYU22576.1 hypothetical protein [Streptomyces sp. SID8352]